MNTIARRRAAAAALMIAALTAAPPAPAQSVQRPAPATPAAAVPSAEMQTMLVQSTLAALNHANLTADYTVLLKLGSRGFQQSNTPELLAQRFRPFRDARIDLTPAVLFTPRFTGGSADAANLRLVGAIPSRPMEVTFDLGYQFDEGRWRIAMLSAALAPPSGNTAGNPPAK